MSQKVHLPVARGADDDYDDDDPDDSDENDSGHDRGVGGEGGECDGKFFYLKLEIMIMMVTQ